MGKKRHFIGKKWYSEKTKRRGKACDRDIILRERNSNAWEKNVILSERNGILRKRKEEVKRVIGTLF